MEMWLQSYITPPPPKSANDLGHVEKLILCFASSNFHASIFVVWKTGGWFLVSNISKLNEEKEPEVGYVP